MEFVGATLLLIIAVLFWASMWWACQATGSCWRLPRFTPFCCRPRLAMMFPGEAF